MFYQKSIIFVVFFILFLVIKTLERYLDPEPDPYPDSIEMLDSDPDSMNPDSQHCPPPPTYFGTGLPFPLYLSVSCLLTF
jgi:hypothetical protein